MRPLLLLTLLCAGCPSSAVLTTGKLAKIETKHTLNTKQTCYHHERLLPLVDPILRCLVDGLVKLGKVKDGAEVLADLRKDPPVICLVEQPSACGWGPCRDYAQCQRRSGCTYMESSVWVAERWPPICSPEWPQEGMVGGRRTGCVKTREEQGEVWPSTLVKELETVLEGRHRLGQAYDKWSTDLQDKCSEVAMKKTRRM